MLDLVHYACPSSEFNSCTHSNVKILHCWSLMSADSFHRGVENAMKSMDKVYDFEDFVKCVSEVGEVIVMQPTNFYSFQNCSKWFE